MSLKVLSSLSITLSFTEGIDVWLSDLPLFVDPLASEGLLTGQRLSRHFLTAFGAYDISTDIQLLALDR